MSSTRHAPAGSPLRQEKFASSFEQGLLANLVAKRCSLVTEIHKRNALWFLQWSSWQMGGLERVSRLIIEAHPEIAHQALSSDLAKLCLDPAFPLSSLWKAVESLRVAYSKEGHIGVNTETSAKVFSALDHCAGARILSLVIGPARIGKTFAAKAWCARSAGQARFVQVPCSNDDIGFFRSIAMALGVTASLQAKATELRSRIEQALGSGDLMLVLDEAHYLWPQAWQRYAAPSRVAWLMTALCNSRVPVALVATPQFFRGQEQVEKLTGWNSEQLQGRIGHLQQLSAGIPSADLLRLARFHLPAAGDDAIAAVAFHASKSETRLGAIDAIASRAAFFAAKRGSQGASTEDVRCALAERVHAFDTLVGVPTEKQWRGPLAEASRGDGDGRAGVLRAARCHHRRRASE